MADSYKFNIGNLVASTKYLYLVRDRGGIPKSKGMSPDHDGVPGYEMYNLKTKAKYWVTRKLAHERYVIKENGKAGQVLFG